MLFEKIKKELKEGNRVEVQTEGSGICFIYQDDNKYYFAGEGVTWQPLVFNTLEDLYESEGYDFLEVV